MDDPDFWKKWAEKANLDLDELANKVRTWREKINRLYSLCLLQLDVILIPNFLFFQDSLVLDTPRLRRQVRRYGNDGFEEIVEMSDVIDDVSKLLNLKWFNSDWHKSVLFWYSLVEFNKVHL